MKSVTIAPGDLHKNPVLRELSIIKLLKDAGIPAFGSVCLEGVESGTLHIEAPDLLTGEVRYSWDA